MRTSELERIHYDPFDRLLVAQAEREHMKLLTHGGGITRYGLPFVIPA